MTLTGYSANLDISLRAARSMMAPFHNGLEPGATRLGNFRPAAALFSPCSSHTRLACCISSAGRGGMPMNSNLTSTLSEFSKGRWASELLKHPSLRPTKLNLKSEGLALPSAKFFSRRDLAHFVGWVHKLIFRMFQSL